MLKPLTFPIFFLIFAIQIECQSPQEINAILKCHNEIRNQIASDGFPWKTELRVSNMRKMLWSERLTNIASEKLEAFREKNAEEIQPWTSFKIFQFPEYLKNHSEIIEKWCEHRKTEIFKNKDLLISNSDEALQMIFSKNEEIGCVLYTNKRKQQSMIGCEYLNLLAENMIPDDVFQIGEACANCKCSQHSEFAKLCVTEEEEKITELEEDSSSEEYSSSEEISETPLSSNGPKNSEKQSVEPMRVSRTEQILIGSSGEVNSAESSYGPRNSEKQSDEPTRVPRTKYEREESPEIPPKGSEEARKKIESKLNLDNAGKHQGPRKSKNLPKIDFDFGKSSGSRKSINSDEEDEKMEKTRIPSSQESEKSRTPKVDLKKFDKLFEPEESRMKLPTPIWPKSDFGKSGENILKKIMEAKSKSKSRIVEDSEEFVAKLESSEESVRFEKVKVRTPETRIKTEIQAPKFRLDDDSREAPKKFQANVEEEESEEFLMTAKDSRKTEVPRVLPQDDDSREAPKKFQEESEEFIVTAKDSMISTNRVENEVPRVLPQDDPIEDQEPSSQDKWQPKSQNYVSRHFEPSTEKPPEANLKDIGVHVEKAIKDPNYIKESAKEYAKNKLGEQMGKVAVGALGQIPIAAKVVENPLVKKVLDVAVVKTASEVVDTVVPVVLDAGKAAGGAVIGVAKKIPVIGKGVEAFDNYVLKPAQKVAEVGVGIGKIGVSAGLGVASIGLKVLDRVNPLS
ncbi:unnamed protein product [Caenorhabditis angaria]|uniref:SCP domain-containing protein n=1 Tax=Caenorhabditis angaria TaxID=860376 RepID=A0A9P1IMM4_9PELO|nr:unnamed protein product [Caenorhabditis angaria]